LRVVQTSHAEIDEQLPVVTDLIICIYLHKEVEMHPRLTAAAIAVFMTTSACEDSNDPAATINTPCSGSVAISVSSGTTPVFTWTPQCVIDHLLVEPTVSGIGDRWSFTGTATSPVTYGSLPSGTHQPGPAQPLVAGSEYRVILENSTSSFFVIRVFRP
jgi:hypothetical protein